MKTKKQILKITAIGVLFISTAGFLFFQQSTLVQEEKQLIIGIWIEDSSPTTRLEFKENGVCYWYFEGDPAEEYTYSISSEFAPNGSEHTFLKLIAINSDVIGVGETVEYAINSLGDDKMTLESIGGFGDKLTYFTKQ